ncbi:hypothetical protein [Flavobacterium aquidurense]|uniref:hypothetical protein n=1 Tax=Flavobacterium aquidurense TaxID=362413 RepID=UPI00285BE84F|nr:hypothetical protein [Flavobacterium aquidurense]MDR7371708.1 hypothetical protein [Flavobacterium aquidurense]
MKTTTSLTYDIDGCRTFGMEESRFEKNHNVILESQEEITSEIPVTFLKNNSSATFILGLFSVSEFNRFFIDGYISIKKIKNKAIVWLFKKTKKSILKATDSNCNNDSMSDPLDRDYSAFVIDSSVIKIQPISIID